MLRLAIEASRICASQKQAKTVLAPPHPSSQVPTNGAIQTPRVGLYLTADMNSQVYLPSRSLTACGPTNCAELAYARDSSHFIRWLCRPRGCTARAVPRPCSFSLSEACGWARRRRARKGIAGRQKSCRPHGRRASRAHLSHPRPWTTRRKQYGPIMNGDEYRHHPDGWSRW